MGLGSSVVERKTENLGVGSPILPPGILKTCFKQVFIFTKKEPNRQATTVG